jgi:hypothetical protein
VREPYNTTQIQCLVEGRLPADLSGALVFSSAQLERLRARIGQLGSEKAALRRSQADLRREHQQLQRDNKVRGGGARWGWPVGAVGKPGA